MQQDLFSRFFTSDMVLFNMQAATNTEVLTQLYEHLHRKGYVKKSYLLALLERERKFPTGLSTVPFAVAIPHTDPEHVLRPCIAIAKLTHPVLFQEMTNESNHVEVRFVFVLVMNDSEKQVGMLGVLMGIFSDGVMMERLLQADSPQAIIEVIKSSLVSVS